MNKIHFRLESGATLCGIDSPKKDERWNWVTCQTCLKKRAAHELAQAKLRAFKDTQEVVVEMVIPLNDWGELVAQLARAQRTHEIMGGMQPALSMLIVQLKKASITTRPVASPTKE